MSAPKVFVNHASEDKDLRCGIFFVMHRAINS
jgi:hypothetical protein